MPYKTGPFLRIFQWRGHLRKGTSGRKGKVEKYSLDLISCNFSMIFAHFQTKRDITRGQTLQCRGGGGRGSNIGAGGGGAMGPPVYMLKKALI